MLACTIAVRTASNGQVGECPFFMKQPRQPAAKRSVRGRQARRPPKLPGTRSDGGLSIASHSAL